MKKLLALVATFSLTLSLVACGNEETEVEDNGGGEEVVEGLTGEISVQAESGWVSLYQRVADEVMAENPEATITIIETGSFDNLDVLDSTDATNPDVADVFAIPADRLYGLAQNLVLASLPVKEMAENIGGYGSYDDGLGGLLAVDGDYLAFPMNIETLVNFANAANAEAAGVDLSAPVELTEANPNDVLIPVHNAWFGVALTNAADIELLGKNADGTLFSDLTMDFADLDAEKQALFEALYGYWQVHTGTNVWDGDAVWGYMDEEFKTGGSNVLRLEGPWSTSGLAEKAGDDLEILPIGQVTVAGNPLAHWKGGWGIALNARLEADQANFDLAVAYVEALMDPANAAEWFTVAGKIVPNAPEGAYSSLSELDQNVIEAVLASYDDAPNRPLFSEWGSVWDTWKNSLLSWETVKPANVEAAYAEVQAAFTSMMEQVTQ